MKNKHTGEASFATHSDFSAEIKDPIRHLNPWSQIWLILSNTTPAVNQDFVREGQIETSNYHGSHTPLKIWYCNHVFSGYTIFSPNVLRSLQSKKHENEQVLATLSHAKNWCQSCLFRLRYFAARCSRSLHSKQREYDQVAAKKGGFWPFTVDE